MDNAWSETNKNASMPAVANVAQDRYFWILKVLHL
jgi:hypothetical protein